MITRYSRKELTDIWEEKNKYNIWLNIELAATQSMEKNGFIPKGISKAIKSKVKINVKKIHAIENKVKHDVIAFLTSINEKIGPKGKFLHQGMTSSDVLDTCFNIQLIQSAKILLNDIDKILKILKKQAIRHKFTLCIGRSHGIHAEPITFGLKLASYYAEFKRNQKRLNQAIAEVSTCAISGAVGTFANIDPRIEKDVAKKLKLRIEPISTQIIPRDRHAYFFSILGIIAGSVERIATEIRNLQRTEIHEVEEFFSKTQKGSSAMPHKKNPILSENLTGLSRLVRSYVAPALENIALWHERDISHSSVERNIGPDSTITLDFALVRLKNILSNINIYPKKMINNLHLTKGQIFSQSVMLELIKKGLSRENAYKILQRHSKKTQNSTLSLQDSLKNDKMVYSKIGEKKLKKIFDFKYHTKKIGLIFGRTIK